MRIGLDGIPLTAVKTGIGHYTSELGHALAGLAPDRDFEFVYPSNLPPFDLGSNGSTAHPLNLSVMPVTVGLLSQHWWSIGLPRYISCSGMNIFHGTNYDIPLWGRCPTVQSIHDLSLFLHPETHEARRVRRARRLMALMARKATVIITGTEAVRREICANLRLSSEKIFTIPDAPRACFQPAPVHEIEPVRRRLGLDGDFLLTVATIEPRKNLVTLARAFTAVLKESRQPLKLAIVGQKGWLSDPLFAEIDKTPAKERIVVTGYLSDEELCALYSSCLLFVYPSIYEGFGLPPLEAMACGAPVIASSIPSLIETVGPAALFFDPASHEDLTRAILGLAANLDARKTLSAEGLLTSAKFSWTRTAEMTLAVYEEALRRFHRS